MKPIRLSAHAQMQLSSRGVAESEIEEAIRNEKWTPAELGRLECRRDYAFNAEWNGKLYAMKQVRPIFVEDDDEIVVVAVYGYYF